MSRIAFVRLENREENHNKFYEMILKAPLVQTQHARYEVIVRYGRINTIGKQIFLRGPNIPNGEAKNLTFIEARNAFLSQLKKKFKDKEYSLIELCVNDNDRLEADITSLQNEFECFTKIADRLEERGF